MAILREFAVMVVRADDPLPKTVRWQARDEAAVRQSLQHVGQVVSVQAGLAVVDWTRGTFNKEEAAEYLRCSVPTIERYMAEGRLPKSRNGDSPIFTKRMLDKIIEERMGAE